MKNYLILYRSPLARQAAMATATPEEQMEGMKPWLAWRDRVGNKMVDFGAPTAGSAKSTKNNPWESAKSEISGYSIVQATDVDSVKSLFLDHPHTSTFEDTTIEIHECVNM